MNFAKHFGLESETLKTYLRIRNNICIAPWYALSTIHTVHIYS